MASLIGKVIDGWRVQEAIKCTPRCSLFKVCWDTNEETKFCMTVVYKDSDNPDYNDNSFENNLTDVNAFVKPEYTYYTSHCFPIVPLKNASGVYEGHEWFVYERVSKPLSDVATSNTLKVSRDDEINIAVQILEILQFLFAQNKVLKNLDVHDFFLRRTTKGYRVILLNQDFYTKESFTIEDTTYTSTSVIHGNGRQPTMRDNVVSFVYIMLFLINKSLPWEYLSEEAAIAKKMDDLAISNEVGEDYKILVEILRKHTLHATRHPRLQEYINVLKGMREERNVTFGIELSKYAKKKRVPDEKLEEKLEEEAVEALRREQKEKEKEEEMEKKMEEMEKEEEEKEKPAEKEEKMEVEKKAEEKEEVKKEEKKIEEQKEEEKPAEKEKVEEEKPVEKSEEAKKEEEKPAENKAEEKEKEKDKTENTHKEEKKIDFSSVVLPSAKAEKRYHSEPETDGEKKQKMTICKNTIKTKVTSFVSSASFMNAVLLAGVALAELKGL
ncbi:hypothetical protein WA577_000266 [Blastocystis sp. JDR]